MPEQYRLKLQVEYEDQDGRLYTSEAQEIANAITWDAIHAMADTLLVSAGVPNHHAVKLENPVPPPPLVPWTTKATMLAQGQMSAQLWRTIWNRASHVPLGRVIDQLKNDYDLPFHSVRALRYTGGKDRTDIFIIVSEDEDGDIEYTLFQRDNEGAA